MSEIGSTWLSIAPSMQGFGKSMSRQVGGEIQRSGVGQKITQTIGGAFKIAGGIATGAIGAVTSAFIANTTAGVRFNASMQGYEVAFRVLTGSADGAARALQAVEEVKVGGSGLDKRALAAASQQLLGVGVSSDDLADRLNRLAKASLDNADTFGLMTRYYAAAAAGAGLTQVQLDALAARGFNPLQVIADHTGRSLADVQREFSGAEGAARALQKAVQLATDAGGQFYNTFEYMRGTINGAMNVAQNEIQILQSSLAQGLMPHLAAVVNGFTPIVTSLRYMVQQSPGLQSLWDTLGGLAVRGVERLYQVAVPLFERLFNFVDRIDFGNVLAFIGSFRDILAPLGGMAIGAFGPILSMVPGLSSVFGGVTGPAGMVLGLLVEMFRQSEPLRDVLGRLARIVGDSLFRAFDTIAGVLNLVGPTLAILGDALAKILDALLPVIPALVDLGIALVQMGVDVFVAAVLPLIPILAQLLAGFITLVMPILQAETAIKALVLAFIGFKIIKKTVIGIIATMKALKLAWIVLKEVLIATTYSKVGATMVAKKQMGLFKTLLIGKKVVLGLWKALTLLGKGALLAFKAVTVAQIAATKVLTVAKGALAAAKAFLLSPILLVVAKIAALIAIIVLLVRNWDAVVDFLRSVWDATVAWLTRTLTSLRDWWSRTWESITGFLSRAWSSIRDTVASAATAVRDRIVAIFTAVRDWVTSTWSSIRDAVVNAARGLRDGAVDWIRNLFDDVRALPGNVLSLLGNLGSLLWSTGRDLIQGMIDGIVSMSRNLIRSITDTVTNALPSFVRNALGINSPSRVFMEIGQQTGLGFEYGLVDSLDHAIDAATKTLDKGLKAFSAEASASLDVKFNENAFKAAAHITGFDRALFDDGDDTVTELQAVRAELAALRAEMAGHIGEQTEAMRRYGLDAAAGVYDVRDRDAGARSAVFAGRG